MKTKSESEAILRARRPDSVDQTSDVDGVDSIENHVSTKPFDRHCQALKRYIFECFVVPSAFARQSTCAWHSTIHRSSHRDSFRKYLFFQEQPFYTFPGGSICFSNRHEFSRRVHLFVEQT